MHLTRIQARLRCGRMNLRKFTPQKIINDKVKETTLKKIVPATMLVAESMTSLSGHAQILTKAIDPYTAYNSRIATRIVPFFPNHSDDIVPIPLEALKPTPKNKFNKNSKFLRNSYAGTAEELDYFIEKLIPKRNGSKAYNPFYKKGKAFIEIGKKYNVNPTLLVAIGMHESGRGTSSAALKKNNIGGITVKSGLKKFSRVEDCIDEMADVINNRIKQNCSTVDAIGKSGKYCDKSVSDLWVKNVMYFINKM